MALISAHVLLSKRFVNFLNDSFAGLSLNVLLMKKLIPYAPLTNSFPIPQPSSEDHLCVLLQEDCMLPRP